MCCTLAVTYSSVSVWNSSVSMWITPSVAWELQWTDMHTQYTQSVYITVFHAVSTWAKTVCWLRISLYYTAKHNAAAVMSQPRSWQWQCGRKYKSIQNNIQSLLKLSGLTTSNAMTRNWQMKSLHARLPARLSVYLVPPKKSLIVLHVIQSFVVFIIINDFVRISGESLWSLESPADTEQHGAATSHTAHYKCTYNLPLSPLWVPVDEHMCGDRQS